MRKPILRRTQEAQLPPSNPNPAGIPIHWSNGTGIVFKIQVDQVKPATKICAMISKQIRRQGNDGQFALETESQKLFVSKSKRRAI
jgi:hypothetical protein